MFRAALRLLPLLAALSLSSLPAAAECDPGGRCCDDDPCCMDGRDNDGDGLIDCEEESCAGLGGCPGGESETDCSDGLDDDGDGDVDCDDEDCDDDPACSGPASESDCSNGEDDDGDGFADCDDPDCADDPACATETDCANGEDDDGDGLIDCADSRDCSDDPACLEGDCSDGVDDDGDGFVDCDDVDCAGVGCCAGPERCDDLRDNDLDGLIDCEDVDRCIDADVCAAPPENCADGVDDDGDELIDCADPECVRFPGCPEPPSTGAPPTLTASLEPLACVWPPNHWWVCYELAELGIEVEGDCGPFELLLIDCVSSQPEDGLGDGSTAPDCVLQEGRVCVRAERAGGDPAGRDYEIVVVAVDAAGRMSEPAVVGTIHVPHDGKSAAGCDRTTRVGTRELDGAGDSGGGDGDEPDDGDGD